MLRGVRVMVVAASLVLVTGCVVQVPPRYEVTDVASGKKFTTYGTWGKENMLGYNFYDVSTGERVMLKSYTSKKVHPGGVYKPESEEATQFLEDQKRVGALGN